MDVAVWYLVAGGLLVAMALVGSFLRRLPLSASMFYLAAGLLLGPSAFGLLRVDPIEHSVLLERVTEAVVVVSLFTAGLKLRVPWRDPLWWLPVRLAFVSMAATVTLIAAVGIFILGLPLGAAVILGAVLAPTDPVLASDVQVADPGDRDRLRFSLTGEAGLNDGTAFPFVLLGLGLLGLHEVGAGGWRWWVVDLAWAVPVGLGIGCLLGTLVARLVVYLRRHHRKAVGLDDFLALGLIALSYGVALMVHAYGFLAVFAAGVALRRVEMEHSGDQPPEEVRFVSAAGQLEEVATDPVKAPAFMAQAVLGFNEQAERIGEVAGVVLLGSMLATVQLTADFTWFVPLLLLLIRPVAVGVGLLGLPISRLQRGLIGWFGIRGIGSLYYLAYAIGQGLPPDLARTLTSLTLVTVAASVMVHGVSATPLMSWYAKRRAASPCP
jgi:NhaP-type Na+/H+ or K+/H+ antiporter